jgi:cytochrome P450
MAQFAQIREQEGLPAVHVTDPFTGEDLAFRVLTRYADVAEVSRRPLDFCSGKGSTAIADLQTDAMEFFGSFIVMDDPRHSRQRNIVARSFTPRALQGVLDSVERICAEVIDGFCEDGEADLVEVLSQPFPLLVICDMMGIPRSEFPTVLRDTNIILGAGDPDMLGGREDVMGALLEAGLELAGLMNELAEDRRKNPTNDLTSALVHNDLGEDMLAPSELAPFFILLAVAGNDTTRTAISHGMNLLAEYSSQRTTWQADLDGLTSKAVEEIVRMASPVVFMRRTTTRPVELAGEHLDAGERLVMFYGAANRDPRAFSDPERFDIRRDPNNHVGFGGPGPHFCLGAHLARREVSVAFRQLLSRLPDIEVTGPPVPLQSLGIPLVGGIKHLPVRFTPSKALAGSTR